MRVNVVDGGSGIFVDSPFLDVAGDADDLAVRILLVHVDADAFAERVLTGEVTLHEGLVDDETVRRVRGVVGSGEIAAGLDGYSHGLKICRHDDADVGDGNLTGLSRRVPFDCEAGAGRQPIERKHAD